MSVSLWVPVPPKAKERPRKGRNGGIYTPRATSDAEKIIAAEYAKIGHEFDGPVAVHVTYSMQGQYIEVEPTSWTSKLRADLDNYLKLTLDGLQRGGAFNDSQVVKVTAVKQ